MHNQHASKNSPSLTDCVFDCLPDLVSNKVQRLENYTNLIIGHLNVNLIRIKFEMIANIIGNFSIFLS